MQKRERERENRVTERQAVAERQSREIQEIDIYVYENEGGVGKGDKKSHELTADNETKRETMFTGHDH